MRSRLLLGLTALIVLLALPGAVSAGSTANVSGSIGQPAPVAAFTGAPTVNSWVIGVAPLAVTFTDRSTVAIGTIDAWKWEYNAGSGWVEFSASQNASHTFTTPGAYDIRLTVSNAGGSSTATKTHFVAASFARDPLVTVVSGTVSGDLFMQSVSPFTTEATQAFTLPATGADIQWARVFVDDYSGSSANNWFVKLTTEIDANGDGDYTDAGETLGVETCDLQSQLNGNAYPLNANVMKVASDYEAWYDVTGLITSTTPVLHVKAEAVTDPAGSMGFDGRIKGLTLMVAYNDGDSDRVKYIVNHGNDWMGPAGATGSTTFDASSFGSGWTDATVRLVAHSSTDATYSLNAGSPTKTNLLSSSYIKWNSFDVKSLLTSGSNTFGYTAVGSSFKITTAALTARYAAPTAAFSATPLSGAAPLTVAFTDASTGAVTGYAWDFDNNGVVDSTDKNPTFTYAAAGSYTVNLTVTGPGGSDEEVKANIITVGSATITVTVGPASIDFGSMTAGVDETGSTQVAVTTDGGTAWSVTAAANNGGYMKAGTTQLAGAFQLANGGGAFQAMTSNFANFMTGTANEDRTDTANVRQAIGAGDQPGSYSITLTFTGGFT